MKYTREWLENEIDKGKSFEFIGFWGEHNKYGEFSNFYHSPFKSISPQIFLNKNGKKEEVTFSCTEQYFMYQKAKLFGDKLISAKILQLNLGNGVHPKQYKDLGRKVQNYNDEMWNRVRFNMMLKGLHLKFSQNERLKKMLLDTGDKILVEASPFDSVWGIKKGVRTKQGVETNWKKVHSWNGQNLLGFALMELRDILREE